MTTKDSKEKKETVHIMCIVNDFNDLKPVIECLENAEINYKITKVEEFKEDLEAATFEELLGFLGLEPDVYTDEDLKVKYNTQKREDSGDKLGENTD